MSEIQANFVVEPITAQIVYSTGQINFTPTTNQLTISTGSAPAAAAPLMSIQYNENGLLAGDGAFYYFNDIVWMPNAHVSGYSDLDYANITHANISNVDYMNANIGNVHISGGQNGYVLVTDGTGNLTWNPENTGSIRASIKAISNADPMVMTVANTTPYINAAKVTISGVLGANANAIVNGSDFYVRISNNFATSGNVSLYQDANLSITANGFGLTAVANTGLAVTYTSTGGGGNGTPGGINGQIQYNEFGSFGGNAGFTFDSVSGNVGIPGNLTIVGAAVDLDVLNYANISNTVINANGITTPGYYGNISGANVITTNKLIVSTIDSSFSTTGNITTTGNISASGNLIATKITGELTASSYYQPNITEVGNLNQLNVTSGNINAFKSVFVGASGGVLGYANGAGGAVTQLSSRTSTVLLNAPTGQITLVSAALAANTQQQFTFTNSFITENDMVLVQHISGGTLGLYNVTATPGAGFATISIRNNSAASSGTQQPVLQFAVIKSSIT